MVKAPMDARPSRIAVAVKDDLANLVARPQLSAIRDWRRAIPHKLAKGMALWFNVRVNLRMHPCDARIRRLRRDLMSAVTWCA